jgi:hypothetical protein
LVFTSCAKEESKQYYQVLGTVSKTDDSTIIVADDNMRFLVQNAGSLIDYVIEVYNYSKVLYKPVIDLTGANADSIGNDPLEIWDIWVAKNYLNLNFEYYGNDQVHLINLVRLPGNTSSDTIELEVRHNDKQDAEMALMKGFVTFNLESLQKEGADSVYLHVKAKEYNSRVYDKYFTYKY